MESNAGTLYVVATPIGNLEDLSPRAVRVLSSVDLIACEDTRHTRRLLTHFSIQTPTTSYHEHNEESKASILLDQLLEGKQIALVSDAGTPLLSDPGYRLVRSCRHEGVPVLPIPGPFAGAAACSVSGLPTDQVLFVGFLGGRAAAQRQELERLKAVPATLVFYLAPHRLRQTLERIFRILGDREAYLVREMTKLHETGSWGTLHSLATEAAGVKPRGEYTLVVKGADASGAAKELGGEIDVAAYVTGLVQTRGMSKKEAIKLVSRQLRLPKREVYGMVSGRRSEIESRLKTDKADD